MSNHCKATEEGGQKTNKTSWIYKFTLLFVSIMRYPSNSGYLEELRITDLLVILRIMVFVKFKKFLRFNSEDEDILDFGDEFGVIQKTEEEKEDEKHQV